jgi:hypothetical protein
VPDQRDGQGVWRALTDTAKLCRAATMLAKPLAALITKLMVRLCWGDRGNGCPSNHLSNNRRRQRWTPVDDTSQVNHVAALAICVMTWLRDGEANASMADGESPTQMVPKARSGAGAIDAEARGQGA